MADLDRREEWLRSKLSRKKDIENLIHGLFKPQMTPLRVESHSDQNIQIFLTDEELNYLAFRFIADVEDLWKKKFYPVETSKSQNLIGEKSIIPQENSNKNAVKQSLPSSVDKSQIEQKNSISSNALAQGARLLNLPGALSQNSAVVSAHEVLAQRQNIATNTDKPLTQDSSAAQQKIDRIDVVQNTAPKLDTTTTAKSPAIPESNLQQKSSSPTNQQTPDGTTKPASGETSVQSALQSTTTNQSTNSNSNLPASKDAGTVIPGKIPQGKQNPAVVPKVPPTFQLPNCNVGKNYSNIIEWAHKSGRKIIVRAIEIPAELGLTFDPKSCAVKGIPKVAGDFDLAVSWSFENEKEITKGLCRLTANPDPRSLWKINEPPNDSPYPKDHLDKKFLVGNGIKIVAASRRGRSHEHSGSFRDDDFFLFHDKGTQWSVVAVADGAGSAKFSREGSRIAVSTAGKFFQEKLKSEFNPSLIANILMWEADQAIRDEIALKFRDLYYEMLIKCIESIEEEVKNLNAQYKDFSTTLLVSVSQKNKNGMFVSSFWIGDGAIATYSLRGHVRLMGNPDSGEFAGQTRFLDRSCLGEGFKDRVSVGKFQDADVVMLLTDGVSDPFFETDNELRDHKKWSLLWHELDPILRDANPDERLLEWIHFFKQGHHDDRTIAVLW